MLKKNQLNLFFFFSKALDRRICEENKELQPLRALKILLVLSSYCMHYDYFQKDFITYSPGIFNNGKASIHSIGRPEGFNDESKSWKFNYGFGTSKSYTDSFLSDFESCKKLADLNCLDQGLISSKKHDLSSRQQTLSTIIELWSCEYMLIDAIIAHLLEFQFSFSLEDVKLISHLSSLPRTVESSERSILNTIKFIEIYLQKNINLLSSSDQNMQIILEFLKMHVFLLDTLARRKSISNEIFSNTITNFYELANSVSFNFKSTYAEHLLTSLKIKTHLLRQPYAYKSIFENIAKFESLIGLKSASESFDYEAEVIFQESRVKLGNFIESCLNLQEQQKMVEDVGFKKVLSKIAYPIAYFSDQYKVNLEAPPSENPSLRLCPDESSITLKDFCICLTNIPQGIVVRMTSENSMEMTYPFGSIRARLTDNEQGQKIASYHFDTDNIICSEISSYVELQKYAPFFAEMVFGKRKLSVQEEALQKILHLLLQYF